MIADPQALALLRRLEQAGYETWIVGGAVRDALLDLPIHDIDLTTQAEPEQIQALFSEYPTLDVGKNYGTIRVVTPSAVYEVTTFRQDMDYQDGRHPSQVAFSRRVEEDLKRRDFTMNALAWHPERGLLDLFDGRRHLAEGRLVAVGKARDRIGEDALRILRAVRFAGRFQLRLDPDLFLAIQEKAGEIQKVSVERIYEELEKTLSGPHPAYAVDLFLETGLWELLFPGFSRKALRLDLLDQLDPDPSLRWVGLFYGYTRPWQEKPREGESLRHQVRRLLRRLHASTKRQREVGDLLALLDQLPGKMEDFRRLLGHFAEAGDRLDRFLSLAVEALDPSLEKERGTYGQALDFLTKIREEKLPIQLSDLALTGQDLIQLGMEPGPRIGQDLRLLLDAVIDGLVDNQKEALVSYLLQKSKMAKA